MTRIVNNETCGIKECNKPCKKTIYFSLGFSANFCTDCADDMVTRGLGIVEGIKKDKIRNKTKSVKIKSLHSVEVHGHGQNAVAANTPAEADGLRP